jgi:thiol-disulfide isomerase/thioredoxin
MSISLLRPFLCIALVGALSASSPFSSEAEAKVREGDRAGKFVSVKDAAGKAFKLKKYKDRIVVLTFGASWCKPCKKELPAFEKLAKKYDKKKVIFVAVNVDSKLSKGKAFAAKAGLKKVVALYDPKSSTVESYDPPTMPSTYIIKRGIVKKVHAGYRSGDISKIEKFINKELK